MRSSHGWTPALRGRRERRLSSRMAGCLWVLLLLASQGTGCGGSARSVEPPSTDTPKRAAPSVAAADTVPAPQVKVEVTDEEKAKLEAQARDDLAQTTAMIDKIDREHVAAEALEKLKTVESLITAAESAGEKGDVTAMANLARKARLLATELLPQ